MRDAVQDYYGQHLQSSDDLQTDACCTDANLPDFVKAALSQIHDAVLTRYYGCGLIAPEALAGRSILDLGCGAGRDVFVLSKLVGPEGHVVGVDMTDEQLAVARAHVDYHMTTFGYDRPNVRFLQGYLEELDRLELLARSFDVIVSNCVINLCTDKPKVLRDAFRLLKPGGEMYFSDVYAQTPVPETLTHDLELYGECLSGALFWEDFNTLAVEAGFAIPRIVDARPLAISNARVAEKLGNLEFASVTYRLFKPQDVEGTRDAMRATYHGTIEHHADALAFDRGHVFRTSEAVVIDGATAALIASSRLGQHFTLEVSDRPAAYETAVMDPFRMMAGKPSCC
ncbi:MAG: methyltransferase domain-containing protein [Pseudomonadota bacterium]